ncbi:protein PBDC1-like isoform X2 [Apostichopus japonicus]
MYDAENYNNDASVEGLWAVQTMHHCETYMNLISSVDSRILKLSDRDDLILEDFCKDFPNFEISLVKEDHLKKPSAKVKWRTFCNRYKEEIKDFNQGLLIRLDCKKDYSEENTILVTKIQFLAIEIARNREGLNLHFWKTKRKDELQEQTTTDANNTDTSSDKNS